MFVHRRKPCYEWYLIACSQRTAFTTRNALSVIAETENDGTVFQSFPFQTVEPFTEFFIHQLNRIINPGNILLHGRWITVVFRHHQVAIRNDLVFQQITQHHLFVLRPWVGHGTRLMARCAVIHREEWLSRFPVPPTGVFRRFIPCCMRKRFGIGNAVIGFHTVRSIITSLTQIIGKTFDIIGYSILTAMISGTITECSYTGNQTKTTWRRNGTCRISIVETYAFLCQTVDIRGMCLFISITTNKIGRSILKSKPENIRFLICLANQSGCQR